MRRTCAGHSHVWPLSTIKAKTYITGHIAKEQGRDKRGIQRGQHMAADLQTTCYPSRAGVRLPAEQRQGPRNTLPKTIHLGITARLPGEQWRGERDAQGGEHVAKVVQVCRQLRGARAAQVPQHAQLLQQRLRRAARHLQCINQEPCAHLLDTIHRTGLRWRCCETGSSWHGRSEAPQTAQLPQQQITARLLSAHIIQELIARTAEHHPLTWPGSYDKISNTVSSLHGRAGAPARLTSPAAPPPPAYQHCSQLLSLALLTIITNNVAVDRDAATRHVP